MLATVSGTSQSGKEWSRQSFVLEVPNGMYQPRHICFDVMGAERIQQFAIRQGEDITVRFDIDAREYNGKWFNSLTAWGVQRATQQAARQAQQMPPQTQAAVNMAQNAFGGGLQSTQTQQMPPQTQDNDLPF